MFQRHLETLATAAVTLAVLSLTTGPLAGQTSKPAAKPYAAPRTVDGQPDLSGVWANNNITPLERPPELGGKTQLTDEDVVAFKKRAAELLDSSQAGEVIGDSLLRSVLKDPNYNNGFDKDTGNYNSFWIVDRDWSDRRTSLITDPPDGRLPALTTEAQQRRAAAADERRQHPFDGPESLALGHRCVAFGSPRLGAGYNSYYQIIQSKDTVVFLMEMAHDARIIPLDGRPHVPDNIREWLGDSRGHWEGNTLVVETTNYPANGNFMGSTGSLTAIEKFTRVGPDTLNYEVTINDPKTWTKPWTALIPLKQTTDNLFEYACHEGNESVEGALAGARAQEKAAQESARKGSN